MYPDQFIWVSAQQGQSWHLASVRVRGQFTFFVMHQSIVSLNGIGDIDWAGQLFYTRFLPQLLSCMTRNQLAIYLSFSD